jgi:hypothetical protein
VAADVSAGGEADEEALVGAFPEGFELPGVGFEAGGEAAAEVFDDFEMIGWLLEDFGEARAGDECVLDAGEGGGDVDRVGKVRVVDDDAFEERAMGLYQFEGLWFALVGGFECGEPCFRAFVGWF